MEKWKYQMRGGKYGKTGLFHSGSSGFAWYQ